MFLYIKNPIINNFTTEQFVFVEENWPEFTAKVNGVHINKTAIYIQPS